jgi:hypothetical protein
MEGHFITPKSRSVENELADEQRSFCFSQRCPLDVYSLSLRDRHPWGSIGVGTRWECCYENCLKCFIEKKRFIIRRNTMSIPGNSAFRVRDYRREAPGPAQSSHHVSSFDPAISSMRHTQELAARATTQATDAQPNGARNSDRAHNDPAQGVDVRLHRTRRIQYGLSDTSDHAIDNTPITDPNNTVRPRDFRENPHLEKDLYMLQRININAIPRIDDNLIAHTQNSNADVVTKQQLLKMMRGINELKDYNAGIGRNTCIDACKSMVDIHNGLQFLHEINYQSVPGILNSVRVTLNKLESDYDRIQTQAQQSRAALR